MVENQALEGLSGKGAAVKEASKDALINRLADELNSVAGDKLNPTPIDIQKLPGGKIAPKGVFVGEVDPKTPLEVTIQLRSKASEAEMDRTLERIAQGKQAPLSEDEFAKRFGSSQQCLDEVAVFAKSKGLQISKANLSSGQVVLKGSAADLQKAFETRINKYDDGGKIHLGRDGEFKIPANLQKDIDGIYGLDTGVAAQSHNVFIEAPGRFSPRLPGDRTSYMPNEIANAYQFPKGTTGKGQGIAIIELGGGIDMANEAAYYKEHGLKMPDIKIVEINGAKSVFGKNFKMDDEVALDSQVIGTVAPDAKQTLIFAPNDGGKGFIDAVTRASFPEKGENQNQAISISWGQPLDAWVEDYKRGMNLALKKAAIKGISVFVASGDDGANDASPSGKPTADYPAGDPFVTAVGGTKLEIKDGKIQSEVTWNDKYGVTGGGISTAEVPEYQKELKMPVHPTTEKAGRGIPDIAGSASPLSGYKIRVRGRETISGGTSAAAPLFAALAVRLNEGLGGQHNVGFMNPFLYKSGLSGRAQFFNDITVGNNNGFSAGKGWDAVTGWGSINGELLLQALKQKLRDLA